MDFSLCDVFLVDAKRTPLGRSHADRGLFRNVRADDLVAQLLQDFAKRFSPEKIDDLLLGCVGQHLEQGKNIARLAVLLAQYPQTVPGVTINRLCGSSLAALHFGAMALESKQADAVLAGGVEHMHHVPMGAALDYSQPLLSSYPIAFTQMGLTAEEVARRSGVSRRDQDACALESHRKAVRAQASGFFEREIVSVVSGDQTIAWDQCPRADTSLEALSQLKPAFVEGGTVTAGNSSPLSDGASLTLLATRRMCAQQSWRPRAQLVDFSVVGLDPCVMGMGPVTAIQKLLRRCRMELSDIGVFEINEAFASQWLASLRALNIPEDRVNLWGGAIALGHPLGCTGTRLITTLINVMERTDQEFGVASLCIGHGQGMAVLVRRLAS